MKLLEFAPPSMVGWLDELERGQHMEVTDLNGLQIKIVITAQGVTAIVLGEHTASAEAVLERLGFRSTQIRRMLCG